MRNKFFAATHFYEQMPIGKFSPRFEDISVPASKYSSIPVMPSVQSQEWRELQVNRHRFSVFVENKRIVRTLEDDAVWLEWNGLIVGLLRKYGALLDGASHLSSSLKVMFGEIPEAYSIRERLLDIENELGEEGAVGLNVRSVFCMLRFLPILEEKCSCLDFFVDEDSGRLGVSLVEKISEDSKKTLDLQFNESGEISFSFMEGGEGFSRVSGTSFLTEYLVNSYKFRKLINIFDY